MSDPIVNHASATLGTLTLNDAPSAPKHAVTVEYVEQKVNDLINSAPGALDTLGELAAALQSSDSNIAGTITTSIASNATDILNETNARVSADGQLQESIDNHSAFHEDHLSAISALDSDKFNKSGGDINGNVTISGNVNVPSAYYLYIGSKWRIEAYGSELHFRYSNDGINWGSGIPFVSV